MRRTRLDSPVLESRHVQEVHGFPYYVRMCGALVRMMLLPAERAGVIIKACVVQIVADRIGSYKSRRPLWLTELTNVLVSRLRNAIKCLLDGSLRYMVGSATLTSSAPCTP